MSSFSQSSLVQRDDGDALAALKAMKSSRTAPTTDEFSAKLLGFFAGDAGEVAAAQIERYFGEHYTGSQFEVLTDADPNRITANDIVAVSTLGVTVPAGVAIWLLSEAGRRAVSELLGGVPTDVDIWDGPSLVAPGNNLWKLWYLLRTACWPGTTVGNGMGPTTISKLMAAKRPRLVPITDSVITKVLPSDGHWAAFAAALGTEQVRQPIEQATGGAPSHLSLLRRIDIAIWMLQH